MMARKKFLMILSLLLTSSILTGCGLFQQKTVKEYVEVPIYAEIQPRPAGLKLLPVHFDVINEENLQQYLAENRKKYGEIVFIAMDVKDYENLSLNTGRMVTYITQQKVLILYYEDQATPKEEVNVSEAE